MRGDELLFAAEVRGNDGPMRREDGRGLCSHDAGDDEGRMLPAGGKVTPSTDQPGPRAAVHGPILVRPGEQHD